MYAASSPTPELDVFVSLTKADLHLHLVGSASPHSVASLAAAHPDGGVPADLDELRAFYAFSGFAHFLAVYTAVSNLVRTPEDVVALLKPTLLYTGVMLAALGIIGRNLCARVRKKRSVIIVFALVACCFPLMLLRWFRPLELFTSAKSSRELARTILASPQRNLPIYGYYYFRTGLPFYLRRPVGLISSTADELTSNYIVTHWPKLKKEAQSGQLPRRLAPASTGGMPLVMEEREWLSKQHSTPELVLIRDDQVTQLANSVGKFKASPLWTGWGYSVWEISASPAPAKK